jgi:hypothetical protein
MGGVQRRLARERGRTLNASVTRQVGKELQCTLSVCDVTAAVCVDDTISQNSKSKRHALRLFSLTHEKKDNRCDAVSSITSFTPV